MLVGLHDPNSKTDVNAMNKLLILYDKLTPAYFCSFDCSTFDT
tara:strand:- start:1655 stop:1783 length:129 start_codon:yes stop_codon:yes gene_type:complete